MQRTTRQCPAEMKAVFNSFDNPKDRELLKEFFEVP